MTRIGTTMHSVGLAFLASCGGTTPRGDVAPIVYIEVLAPHSPAPCAPDASLLSEALGGSGFPQPATAPVPPDAPFEFIVVAGNRESLITEVHLALQLEGAVCDLASIGTSAEDRMLSAFARVEDVAFGAFSEGGERFDVAVVIIRGGTSETQGCDSPLERVRRSAYVCLSAPTPRCIARVDLGPAEYDEDNRLPSPEEAMLACEDAPTQSPATPSAPWDRRVQLVDGALCVTDGEETSCSGVAALAAAYRAGAL